MNGIWIIGEYNIGTGKKNYKATLKHFYISHFLKNNIIKGKELA